MDNSIAPLFLPAHIERRREKALQLGYECLLLDLEDAVPPAEKERARQGAAQMLRSAPDACHVRINPLRADGAQVSGCGFEDLAAVVSAELAGVIAPKVDSADDVQDLDAAIAAAERAAGLPVGRVPLGALIESARGVVNLSQIATATIARPLRLLFGLADLNADLGIDTTRDEQEGAVARAWIPLVSRAARLQRPLDCGFFDLSDPQGLRASALRGKALGYAGKGAIHPDQVAVILEAYRPPPETVARAQRIVEAAEAHASQGDGAFVLDGHMIDRPIILGAQEVLDLARRTGG